MPLPLLFPAQRLYEPDWHRIAERIPQVEMGDLRGKCCEPNAVEDIFKPGVDVLDRQTAEIWSERPRVEGLQEGVEDPSHRQAHMTAFRGIDIVVGDLDGK